MQTSQCHLSSFKWVETLVSCPEMSPEPQCLVQRLAAGRSYFILSMMTNLGSAVLKWTQHTPPQPQPSLLLPWWVDQPSCLSWEKKSPPLDVVSHAPRAPVSMPWKWTHAKACPHTALQQADRAANTKQRNLTLKEAEECLVGPEFRAGSSSLISALRSLCSVVFSFNVLFGKLKHPHKRRESNKLPHPYYSVSTMINFCPSLFHVPFPHAELRLCFFGVYSSWSQISWNFT